MTREATPNVDLALFGALGDLALRKLYPALYHLDRDGLLGTDTRILAGAPVYEAALRRAGVSFESHIYEGASHGFHNNTTPRYDEAANTIRTIGPFFESHRRH